MKRASAAFTAIFLLSASSAFSQGNFLKKGQYGLGLNGAYATNNSASGYSGTAVVTLGGIFDLSFGAGHEAFDTSEYGDLISNSLAPEFRAHTSSRIRPSRPSPSRSRSGTPGTISPRRNSNRRTSAPCG